MIREHHRPSARKTIVVRALNRSGSSAGNRAPLTGVHPAFRPSEPAPARRGVLLLGAGVVVAALAIGTVARLIQSRTLAPEATEDAGRRVSVARPERAAAGEVTLPATLLAYQWTDLHARASGYLKRWTADIGTRVKAGEVLAEIDTPELDRELEEAVALLGQGQSELEQARAEREEAGAEVKLAEANLLRARANLDFAASQIERSRRLVASRSIAREEYDGTVRDRDARKAEEGASVADLQRRTTNLATRDAIIKSREATVRTRQANARRLRELQGFKRVTAPFDGVVTRRTAEVGMLVNAGNAGGQQPLFSLARQDLLRVQANVPQSYAGSVRLGDDLAIAVPKHPGRTFLARVARTAGAVDPTSRTLRVELELPNEDNALLPGGYAQLRLLARPADATLLVPAGVLLMRPDGPHVAAVGADGAVRLRKIVLGRDQGRQVEVVEGLAGDESLIVNPTDDLRDGHRVRMTVGGDGSEG